ncbi:RNA-directed DNA polymerase, eukaryota [Tanacetum coccineum]
MAVTKKRRFRDDKNKSLRNNYRDQDSVLTKKSHMNFMSLNIQGLGQRAKKDWIKELCTKNKVNFVSLQETKMETIELFNVKECWGNFAFEYKCGASVGNSGGILCIWDPSMFRNTMSTASDYFIMSTAGLEEVHLRRLLDSMVLSQSATKMSKLDRFLISEGLAGSCPNISAVALDRYLSDHRPILLLLDSNFHCKLDNVQQADLESNVTSDEIKRAVWDCGVDKSPGPDGFTFGFYRRAGLFKGISTGSVHNLFIFSMRDDADFLGSYGTDSNNRHHRGVARLLFRASGSKVGGLMSRIKSWEDIMNTFVARLSKWKMKTLSIGGIHGENEKLDRNTNNEHPSIWLDIVREVKKLKCTGTDLLGFIQKKLGNGSATSFWEDVWRGDISFKYLYPRLFALETSKSITVASEGSLIY